jgi:hypothetical protein
VSKEKKLLIAGKTPPLPPGTETYSPRGTIPNTPGHRLIIHSFPDGSSASKVVTRRGEIVEQHYMRPGATTLLARMKARAAAGEPGAAASYAKWSEYYNARMARLSGGLKSEDM